MTIDLANESLPQMRLHTILLSEQVAAIVPRLNAEESYKVVQECSRFGGFFAADITEDSTHLVFPCSNIQNLPTRIFELTNGRSSPWRSWCSLSFDAGTKLSGVVSNAYEIWISEIARNLSSYNNLHEMIREAAWYGLIPQTSLRDVRIALEMPKGLANRPLYPNNVPRELRRDRKSLETLSHEETLDRFRGYWRDQQLRKVRAVLKESPDKLLRDAQSSLTIPERLGAINRFKKRYPKTILSSTVSLPKRFPAVVQLSYRAIKVVREMWRRIRSRTIC